MPVIIVEPLPGRFPRGRRVAEFTKEIFALARANQLTQSIRHVLFYRVLPVDVRHNAKINREALADWAAKRIR